MSMDPYNRINEWYTKPRALEYANNYRVANTNVCKQITRRKYDHLQSPCAEIQQWFGNNNTWLACEIVKQLTKQDTAPTSLSEYRADENLLRDPGNIQKKCIG